MTTIGIPEFADNPEPRCGCLILADTSASMSGKPIQELNRGLGLLKESLMQDPLASLRVEPGLITFGGSVEVARPIGALEDFNPPRLKAGGGTPMGEAICQGLQLIEDRKAEYKRNSILYYCPWVFLITDGSPTDSWQHAAALVHQGEQDKKFLFFAVGVEGASMDTLGRIAPPNRPPVTLKGLEFKSMFSWLSASMRKLAMSNGNGEQVALDPIDSWAQVGS